jgi:hypothetical protein
VEAEGAWKGLEEVAEREGEEIEEPWTLMMLGSVQLHACVYQCTRNVVHNEDE